MLEKGDGMDLMIIGIAAAIFSIAAAIAAIILKKPKLMILLYWLIGAVVGFGIGYFAAPVIISYF